MTRARRRPSRSSCSARRAPSGSSTGRKARSEVGCHADGTRQQHLDGLAAFLTRGARSRFHQSIENERLRRKIRNELWHFERYLDDRYLHVLGSYGRQPYSTDDVYELLMERGAPATCFVFAAASEFDPYGDERELRTALADLMWPGGGFLSCVPGRLALYVGEWGSNLGLLTR